MKQKLMAMLLAGGMVVTVSACDGPNSLADVDVRFAADLTGDGNTVASVLGEQAGVLGGVALSSIDSINVTITGVDAVRSEGDEGYIQLTLAEGAEGRINLLDLPEDGGGAGVGVQLARGSVPAGTYTGIRLRYDVATATIALNEDVTVGGETFTAGTYTLEVPSGPQTGIKVPFASLTLAGEDAGNVVLTFDADATIQHVTATGAGKLLLVPVLQVRASVED
jgi:hypothetical protein